MDALRSLDGITDGRTNIKKFEIYLKATQAANLTQPAMAKMIEEEFGYSLRSFQRVEGIWDEYR